ncbi:MAG: aa3-type cytochrome c oxidase subunit IV [Pseudomonadota bacterium]
MAEHQDETPQRTLAEHEGTFEGFIKAAVIVAVVSIAILIFLAFVGT